MIATLAKHLKETLLELHHKIGKGPSPLTLTPPPHLHTLAWRIWNLVCCWHEPKQRSLGGLILGETNILKLNKLNKKIKNYLKLNKCEEKLACFAPSFHGLTNSISV